jgi:hypothetical protein
MLKLKKLITLIPEDFVLITIMLLDYLKNQLLELIPMLTMLLENHREYLLRMRIFPVGNDTKKLVLRKFNIVAWFWWQVVWENVWVILELK